MKSTIQTFVLFASLLSVAATQLMAQATQTVIGRVTDEANKSPVTGDTVILVRKKLLCWAVRPMWRVI
jgi:hypothetical protein